MKIEVFKSGGYVDDNVSSVPTQQVNLNEENRIKFVTDLAAISRGNYESKNPTVRYKQLLKEAAPNNLSTLECPNCHSNNVTSLAALDMITCLDCGNEILSDDTGVIDWISLPRGTPSRPLEFLPIVLEGEIASIAPLMISIKLRSGDYLATHGEDFLNTLSKFGYTVFKPDDGLASEFLLYTNMRACLNYGIDYEDIPYNTAEELEDFKAIRIKAPMFVFNHLVTHTALSKEARSERVTELVNTDYWLPDDFRTKVYDFYEKNKNDSTLHLDNSIAIAGHILTLSNVEDIIVYLVSGHSDTLMSQTTIQNFFKEIGYPKEIYQRAMLEFRYKEFIMTGWSNNPQTWQHLCVERNAMPEVWKNWTQPETSAIVRAIQQIVFPNRVNTLDLN